MAKNKKTTVNPVSAGVLEASREEAHPCCKCEHFCFEAEGADGQGKCRRYPHAITVGMHHHCGEFAQA